MEAVGYVRETSRPEANIEADFYMVAGDYNADGSYFDEDTAISMA